MARFVEYGDDKYLFTTYIMNVRMHRLSGVAAMTLVLATSAVGFNTQTAQAATKPSCVITSELMFPQMELIYKTPADLERIKKLQDVLEYEGYTIHATEKTTPRKYGATTAAAVVESQRANLSRIRTLAGNTTYKPTGYLDGMYDVYLEAEYGCASGTFSEVTYPDGGESFEVGKKYTITWKTDAQIKSSAKIDITLIDETSSTAKRELIKNVANTGKFEWTVPTRLGSIDLTSSKSKYRVEIAPTSGSTLGNGAIDRSDAQFTIGPTVERFAVVTPAKGSIVAGSSTTTKVSATNIAGASSATIRLVRKGSTNSTNLVSSTNVTNLIKGVLTTIPESTSAGTYRIVVEIRPTTGSTVVSDSAEFEVLPKTTSISVSALKGSILQGASTTTEWTYSNIAATTPVVLKLIDNSGTVVTNLVSTGVLSAKKATIKIPTTAAPGTYKVRLEASIKNGPTVSAESTSFTVAAPNLAPRVDEIVLSKQTATSGSSIVATWKHANVPNNTPVVIKLVDRNDREISNLVTSGVTAASKKATLVIPTFTAAGTYKVRVTANIVNGTPVSGLSGELKVDAPDASSVTITSSHKGSIVQGASTTTNWTFAGLLSTTPVVIRLVDTSGNVVTNLVSTGLTAATKKSTYKIPATVAAGTYKIRVDANIPGGRTVSASSDSFSVVAPDLTPTLTNLSLSTSAADVGGSVTVQWTSANLVGTVPVVVKLVKENGDEVANLVNSGLTVASKKSTFKIPASVSAGTYKVRVTANIPRGTSVSATTGNLVVSLPVPAITATVPTGGTVVSGKATTTRWTIVNIPATTPVVIALVNASDNSVVSNLVSSGLAASALARSVTIPASVADGSYKLRLTANIAGGQSVTTHTASFTVDKP
jgi:hypothetical protein